MDALALLRLQIEWGADEALEDAPVDRLRAPGRVQRQADAGQGEGQPQGQGQAQAQRLPLPMPSPPPPAPPPNAPPPPPAGRAASTTCAPHWPRSTAAPCATRPPTWYSPSAIRMPA